MRGKDLKIGDVIRVINRPRQVVAFDAHPGIKGEPARVARFADGGVGMTVFDSDQVDRADMT
jgi:hypothetical protein